MKLVITSGFLGSGKTTAILNACIQLAKERKSVAVITNDQGDQQVDGDFINSKNIPVREVSNGCFCCNFSQLDNHIESLVTAFQPAFIFAESVGSCTDLVATIALPFTKFKPALDIVIPVFADAQLLSQIIKGEANFLNEAVRYIYKKQLEDADIIILNKTDLLSESQLKDIGSLLKEEYPLKKIIQQNSLSAAGIRQFINAIELFKSERPRAVPAVDYDIYATGEAALAWLDKKIQIKSELGNAPLIAGRIARQIKDSIMQHQWVIGHLKFLLSAGDTRDKISYTSTDISDKKMTTEFFSTD